MYLEQDLAQVNTQYKLALATQLCELKAKDSRMTGENKWVKQGW